MIDKKILSSKPFWIRISKEVRDKIKDYIFEEGHSVYGKKWLDGKYSKFPSKWVMITIKEGNKKSAPKKGYSYDEAKKGDMFPTQSSTKVNPILTGNLKNDLQNFNEGHNGFKLHFKQYGYIVDGLRERFGKKGTITSVDRPIPIKILKYIAKEYHLHIKRNKTCKTTRHIIGKK